MQSQPRRDILLALSVKAALLAALLIGLSLAIPRPANDNAATATVILGGPQVTTTPNANREHP